MIEIIKYYVDLLIMQYKNRPKARAQVETFVKEVVCDQLPKQVESSFDINTAVGVQLDTIGKYIGVYRSAQGPNGPIVLSEPDFRILIQIGIIKRNFGSSLFDIQDLLSRFFSNEIFVFDYLNMRMGYFIDSMFWSNELVQMMIYQDLLPYPLAVGRSSTIYYPDITHFYGFINYESPLPYNNTPMTTYEEEQFGIWLDYDFAINPTDQSNYCLLTENSYVLVQENDDKMYMG